MNGNGNSDRSYGRLGGNRKIDSWDSPASKGASVGPGEVEGAGELNAPGSWPGPAARRVNDAQMPSRKR